MAQQSQTEKPPTSITARVLAVIALMVAFVVLAAVVASSLGGGSSSSGGTTSSTSQATTRPKPAQKYYVVKEGDTFVGIAAQFHIPVGALERLNPNLDTQQLGVTNCVNLVVDGCKVLTQGG